MLIFVRIKGGWHYERSIGKIKVYFEYWFWAISHFQMGIQKDKEDKIMSKQQYEVEVIEGYDDFEEDQQFNDLYYDRVSEDQLQGWFSFAKKLVKKAAKVVKKQVSKVVKSPVSALKTAFGGALGGPLGAVVGPALFDSVSKAGKTLGKKVVFSPDATKKVFQTAYLKGLEAGRNRLLRDITKMTKHEILSLRTHIDKQLKLQGGRALATKLESKPVVSVAPALAPTSAHASRRHRRGGRRGRFNY